MENTKGKGKNIILGILFLVLGLLLSIGVATIFQGCGQHADGSFSKCHWSQQAIVGAGAALTALGIIYLFLPRAACSGLSLAAALFGALIIAIPNLLIGVCDMPSMHCRTMMQPVSTVLGVITVIIGILNAVYLLHKEKTEAWETDGK